MVGDIFHTPNGMLLRPSGERMIQILKDYKGDARIYRLHEGVLLPPSLVYLYNLFLSLFVFIHFRRF